MEQPIQLAYNYPSSGIPTILDCGQVQRPVFLDGANIIMGMKRKIDGESVTTVSSIIALLRHFTKNGFQAYIVVQQKYIIHPVNVKAMFKTLYENGCLFTQPVHVYDDCAFFEMARVSGGVVVSHDNFNDHPDICDLVNTRAIKINFIDEKTDHHKLTADGHYIAFHKYTFQHADRFLANPSDSDYALVKDRRRTFNEARQKELIALFDKMLYSMRKYEGFLRLGPNNEFPQAIMEQYRKENGRFNKKDQSGSVQQSQKSSATVGRADV